MSAPNEFVPSTSHAFHHEGVTSLVIQAAHSNSNFPQVTNANGGTAHFNGGGFFPNNISYDVTMLPLFHPTSQRPAHFNAAPFSHQKPVQTENASKQELTQIPTADGRSNVFNPEANSCPSPVQPVYWSRQSQLSPFGVLPHEISPDHMDESKSPYENQLNPQFSTQPLNNLNPMPECDKKTQVIVSGKPKEPVKRQAQYIPKPNEMKMNSTYSHDEMSFRNGVINHGGHTVVKVDQKLVNSNYKKNELVNHLQVTESVNTVPRDYRVFKSPNLFPNASSPVVKYTGKPPKQYVQKQIPDNKCPQPTVPVMKNQRLSAGGSPLISKMSDFQEDSQSSPISLTSDDINERRYSSPSEVPNSIKEVESENSFHNLNHMNSAPQNISIPAPSGYRELQDINCHNTDKNKVTTQFLKLPYAPANVQNNVISETCHLNRKPGFGPLYIMYNNPVNSPGHAPVQKPLEKPSERIETQVQQLPTNNMKLNSIPPAESSAPMMSKPVQNGLIGYPSVIMRTDRNYESEEKIEKSPRSMQWTGADRQVPSIQQLKSDKVTNYRSESNPQLQASLPDHQHLLLGLTERQHSYFDTAPCPQIPPMNNVKCSPKNVAKNIYEEQRIQEQHQHQMPHSQSQEQMHHYQYLPANKAPVPINHPPVGQPEVTDKLYPRKRKSSKSSNQTQSSHNNLHMMDNRVPMTEYLNRDPPPAHVNMYPPQVQNSNYMVEGGRYDPPHTMAKLYPSNEQFYSQNNLNYNVNPMVNVPHDSHHHHQSVISSHSTSSARLSPANSQPRQISPISSSLPLSAYFSSFHPSSHYAHHEFSAGPTCNMDPAQSFSVPEAPTSYPENTSKVEKEVYESRVKVIVPNVEEEFKFLFDPALPHFKQISSFEEEERYKTPIGKPTFYRKNIDFLASYIKFLENNCESVESLTDSNSNTMKNWNRTKVVYQPVIRDKDETVAPVVPPVPKEPEKPTKEPECNFENDPRYYPLPKSSDKRRLCDSSSDEEPDELSKKAKPIIPPKKPVVVDVEKKKTPVIRKKEKKEPKPAKRKQTKKEKKEPKTETKTVKSKLEKLEKAKIKIEKLQKKNYSAEKLKPKMEKALAEIKAIKQSQPVRTPKKKPVPAKEAQKSVPRRKLSERKAKDEVKSKLKGAIDSEDEMLTSSDSDPSWTPRDDDDENGTKRRSTRSRSVRVSAKASKKRSDRSSKNNLPNNLISKKNAQSEATEPLKVPKTPKKSTSTATTKKIGQFYLLKSPVNPKRLELWCLKGGKLQKFDQRNHNGKHQFCKGSEMAELSEVDLSNYQETEVSVVERSKDRVVVELRKDTNIPTDTKIKENFMKESLCYEHQFAVYIQTLVSQALDSNFLSEIVKENDVYFLNNMKVIDDVTATYLSDLTSVVKWGANSVDLLVKTWPFLSIKNIRNESCQSKCTGCSQANARQTAIFYGQPYLRETLQGCLSNPSIPDNLDKTVNLCGGCTRKIKLFNKIWHQKYHVFVECAKYVSKKKTENKNKGTTDILNDLLADTVWLSKLFYDIRNTWLQIWTTVRKTKKS